MVGAQLLSCVCLFLSPVTTFADIRRLPQHQTTIRISTTATTTNTSPAVIFAEEGVIKKGQYCHE